MMNWRNLSLVRNKNTIYDPPLSTATTTIFARQNKWIDYAWDGSNRKHILRLLGMRSLPFLFLTPVNPFEFTSQNASQISCLAPHRILVDCDEFLEGLESQMFREILNHTEDSLIKRTINLTSILDALENRETIRKETNNQEKAKTVQHRSRQQKAHERKLSYG